MKVYVKEYEMDSNETSFDFLQRLTNLTEEERQEALALRYENLPLLKSYVKEIDD